MEITCKKCNSVNNYHTEKKANNLVAYCNSCGAFIKNIPQDEPKFYFGKYKGLKVSEMNYPEHLNYFKWCLVNLRLPETLSRAIEEKIKNW